MTKTIESIAIEKENTVIEIDVMEAQVKLREILPQVKDEDIRVILKENGEKKAAIISLEAFLFLERMIEKIEDEIDLAEAERRLSDSNEIPIPFE